MVPESAFVAGLVTSIHCAGMCGPLACALIPARSADIPLIQAAYHLSRVLGYALLGALGGALGHLPVAFGLDGFPLWLPWALVAYFLVTALRLDAWIPRHPALGRLHGRAAATIRRLPRPAAAAGLGLLTPFLPCGPLYFVLSLAVFSGGALAGAEFMIAFGVGTIPLLWLAQTQLGWLQRRISPLAFLRLRQSLALASAVVLIWRLRSSFGLEGPSVESFICH